MTKVTEELRGHFRLTDAAQFIRDNFEENPEASWDDVVEDEHTLRLLAARNELNQMVRDEILSKVTGELDD